MNHDFDVSVSKVIAASTERIWTALIDPTQVKEWMFGTDVASDWKKGSSLTYSGVWNGKPYQDHGVIQEINVGQLLKTTYFSPLSGKEDIPENYNVITYMLTPEGDETKVTITHENSKSQEEAEYMRGNWQQTLGALDAFIMRSK